MSTKAIRVIANIGILSPLIWIIGGGIALAGVYFADALSLSDRQQSAVVWILAILLAGPFAAVPFLFPIGVILHAAMAWHHKESNRWAWRWILAFSVLWAFQSDGGLRLMGMAILVLLFLFEPFKILRRGVATNCGPLTPPTQNG